MRMGMSCIFSLSLSKDGVSASSSLTCGTGKVEG